MYPGALIPVNLQSIPAEVFTVGHVGLAHIGTTQGAGMVDGQDTQRKAGTREDLSAWEGLSYCGDRYSKNSWIKTMLAIKDKSFTNINILD